MATSVRNYGTDYYGDGYSAAITFKPSASMKIVNTHKYKVQIGSIYTYSFRLFREESTLKTTSKKSTKKTSKKVTKKTKKSASKKK